MKRIYRSFKTECPSGLITEEAFHAIYSRFFPHGGKNTLKHDICDKFLSNLNIFITFSKYLVLEEI